jgi:hypothetical protein
MNPRTLAFLKLGPGTPQKRNEWAAKIALVELGVNLWKTAEVSYCQTDSYSTEEVRNRLWAKRLKAATNMVLCAGSVRAENNFSDSADVFLSS